MGDRQTGRTLAAALADEPTSSLGPAFGNARYRVDWVRGLGSFGLFGFIGLAAIYAGGWQGWVLGAAFLLLAVGLG